MGYYSDTALCLNADARIKLRELLDNSSSRQRETLEEFFINADYHYTGHAAEMWVWTGIKWYADFPEMRFVSHALTRLEESDYLFIRLGESDDDTEIQGYFHDNPFGMNLSRTIDFSAVKDGSDGQC